METSREDPSPSRQSPDVVLTGSAAEARQYEFTPSENATIANLAWKMNFVGLFVLALGILVILFGVLTKQGFPFFSGVLYAIVGLWTQRSAGSFRKVVDTQGKDITHLMFALEDLRKLFTLQFWICLIALVAVVAGLVVVIRTLNS